MEEIPDKNIFMMCESLNENALSILPNAFYVRNCRKSEFHIWKAMPFDNPIEVKEYDQFMVDFFEATYGGQEDLFFKRTLFVCNHKDEPIATCLLWKAYREFNTIHWMKVLKNYEGMGIGRALLSIIMKGLPKTAYPIYLHTQPGSYRAIKLYSDFGFQLLSDKKVGNRINDLAECLPILKEFMPNKDYEQLKINKAPSHFLNKLETFDIAEF